MHIDKSQIEMYSEVEKSQFEKKGEEMRTYLKRRREELCLTQKDIANAIGVSQNYYCDIENGERQKDMKATILIKLSEVLRIPVSKMLEEERALNKQ